MAMDVRGSWKLKQANGPDVVVTVNAEDPDGSFAAGNNPPENTASFDGISGPIQDARATDQELTFKVPWSNGPIGRYVGHFDFQGRLTGVTFNEANPGEQSTWVVNDKTFGRMA